MQKLHNHKFESEWLVMAQDDLGHSYYVNTREWPEWDFIGTVMEPWIFDRLSPYEIDAILADCQQDVLLTAQDHPERFRPFS